MVGALVHRDADALPGSAGTTPGQAESLRRRSGSPEFAAGGSAFVQMEEWLCEELGEVGSQQGMQPLLDIGDAVNF